MAVAPSPKITLSIDNCFASKRWTRPNEWARVVRSLGLRAIETSADTECDPLYGGPEYFADWVREVQEAEARHGVKVVTMYSGHGTYATLGLAHTDHRVRDRMLTQWLFPLLDAAAAIDAGVGFFTHAFPQAVLDDPVRYATAVEQLHRNLAEVARYADGRLAHPVGVEQMYTPHQYPWRIGDALHLMRSVTRIAGAPFYALLDVGHMSGQHRFQRPSRQEINLSITAPAGGTETWIGPPQADELRARARAGLLDPTDAGDRIAVLCDEHPYLFASPEDTDPYAWLEAAGAWSPIVHLQQTDGTSSRHLPFTDEANEAGIIDGPRVLGALAHSVAAAATASVAGDAVLGNEARGTEPEAAPLPPPVDHIYLTIEVFASTAEHPTMIIEKLRRTVAYWRRWIPDDGARLDELVAALPESTLGAAAAPQARKEAP